MKSFCGQYVEYYIPLISNEIIKLSVIPTDGAWYGVTYQADRPTVVAALKNLTEAGHYEGPLWN
ncbi:MAG: hypothetical protein AB8G86_24835 [Saprospiraceae bacterium]